MVPKERLVEGVVISLSVAGNIACHKSKNRRSSAYFSRTIIGRQPLVDKLRIKTSGSNELVIQLPEGISKNRLLKSLGERMRYIDIIIQPAASMWARGRHYSLIREMVITQNAFFLRTLDECIGMSNRVWYEGG
jgi:ABC-type sugar transport system ATPase subunit